ncbi:MAG: 3-deoxy-8-phosphooctulonate synthase [Oligoflexales bacterium]
MQKLVFKKATSQPIIIAGPCLAESWELLDETADLLKGLEKKLGFQLIFKSSFDKANRTSLGNVRSAGMDKSLDWFGRIKDKYSVPFLTDVHETAQVAGVAEICDVLQIPAFLCRQTDLVVAAVQTGRAVNIKKGQFLSPEATQYIFDKAKAAALSEKLPVNVALTERGFSFGYGDLIVDMRSFPVLAQNKEAAVIFDITHSVQKPSASAIKGQSGAERHFCPILARSAAATGYTDGFFLEVHATPKNAKSDKESQLSFAQCSTLLEQLIPLWKSSKALTASDQEFRSDG